LWWRLFFRILGLHQTRNVKCHGASFFLGLISEAPVHRPGNLVRGERTLVQRRAGLERLVAALVVATGAPCEEKLLAFCQQASAVLVQESLIGCRRLACAPRMYGDSSSQTKQRGREEKRCVTSVHGCPMSYSG